MSKKSRPDRTNVDHWPNTSFVTVTANGRHFRPDTFFCQYTVGKMKPNYPVPAIRYTADWFPKTIDGLPNQVYIFRTYTDDIYELPEIVERY